MGKPAGIAALCGLLLFTGVIAWQGVAEIASALSVAGWGLLLVAAWHLVPLMLDALGWWILLPGRQPGFVRLVWARWLGESINGLLPVAQIGGDIAKVRLLTLRGHPGPVMGAGVVVDTTISMVTQILFAMLGVGLLLRHLGQHELVPVLSLCVALAAGLAVCFYALQRKGLFARLARGLQKVSGGGEWLKLTGGAQAVDAAINHIYQQPGRVMHAAVWRFVAWLMGAAEVWLALYFLGVPVSWEEAMLLEALGQAVRGAAFLIPGALGAQEGGYLLLGMLLGLTPEVSLSLSLAKRARELLLGLPGLLAWQWVEGGHLRVRARLRAGGTH